MNALTPLALRLTLACYAAAALLHIDRVPAWCVAVAVLAPAWRMAQARVPLPGTALRALIVVAMTAATLGTFRTLNGLAAGSTLLLAMGAAKILETRQRRDAQVVVISALLLLLAACLDRQGLWRLPLYVATLWLACAALASLGAGGTSPRAWPAFAGAAAALLWAVPLAALLFVFVPRLPGALWSLPPDAQAQTGLSDQMSPGSITELAIADDPVFRVRFQSPPPAPEDRYWRGPVLHQFDGYTWSRGPFSGVRQDMEPVGDPVRYSVMLEPSQRNWLFGLEAVAGIERRATYITYDGQVVTTRPITTLTAYEAYSHVRPRFTGPLPVTTRRADTQLPPQRNPRSRALAMELRASAPSEQAFLDSVLAVFRDGGFEYTLAPPLLGRDSVDELLFDTKLGFCGHFASAYVSLVRAAGIPARVVTGYHGGEWNSVGEYFLVRQSHAHAWAEVWLEEQGWIRVDPTAVVAPGRLRGGLDDLMPDRGDAIQRFTRRSLVLREVIAAWDASNHWWQERVVNFNQAAQRGLLERLGLQRTDWSMLAWLLLGSCALWAGAVAAWYRWRGRPAPVDADARQWLRWRALLARRGLAVADHEPPLAVAARAARAWPEAGQAIRRFVDAYVARRYGTPASAAAHEPLAPLLREVRKAIGRHAPLDDFEDLAGLPLRDRMPAELRARVSRLAVRMLRRVHFEGCGGLILTDHMRRVIAFQACVLIARHGPAAYSGLRAVLVYPDAFIVPQETEDEAGVITRGSDVLSGQTEDTSRVLLSWKDVEEGIDGPPGYNVVLHEFAHVIDHALSGTLSRRDADGDADWHDVFEAEYEALCGQVDAGAETLIDPYGTEDPVEFFAVATETFFEVPHEMRALHPRLHAALAKLYGLDPAAWPG